MLKSANLNLCALVLPCIHMFPHELDMKLIHFSRNICSVLIKILTTKRYVYIIQLGYDVATNSIDSHNRALL